MIKPHHPAVYRNVFRDGMPGELIEFLVVVAGAIIGFLSTVPALPKELESLAKGASPAKQDHLCCVRIAAGQACLYQDRSSCMGCGAEVYTRSSFHLLVQEYVYLAGKIKKAEGKEMVRLSRILQDGALAAITQFLESARILKQDQVVDYYLTILERGKQHQAVRFLSGGADHRGDGV